MKAVRTSGRRFDSFPMNPSQIPLLSFFSGAGFLDIGFLNQKAFNIVWHNECQGDFARAYEYGVGRLGYNTSNNKIQSRARMENLTSGQVLKQAFGGGRPGMFGIIGGPPCPDFSRAGKNNGRDGENGKLTGKFLNMVSQLRPTFFLMENVPGLLETKKHRAYMFSRLKKLHDSYAVDLKILNALEYGVPQNRRRLFIVGISREWLRRNRRGDFEDIDSKSGRIVGADASAQKTSREVEEEISMLRWFCWPKPKFPGALSKYKKEGVCPVKLTVADRFAKINGHPNAGDCFVAHSNKIKRGLIEEGDVSRKSFKRLHRFLYSPNAAYGNNEVHLHPTENRRISVAEALALQSVPAKYAFPEDMTLTAKFKAVGNGVPVPLAKAMACAIMQFLQQGGGNGTL